MKKTYSIIILIVVTVTNITSQISINGGFEKRNPNGNPKNWDTEYKTGRAYGYNVTVDSVIKQEGKYSLQIHENTSAADKSFGACALTILNKYNGTSVTLKGYLKTEDVKDGWGGLWMRINNENNMLEFNNMQQENIIRTNDWKEYSITLPLAKDAVKIVIGGLLVGEGKVWIDNLRVYIDDKPIEYAPLKK